MINLDQAATSGKKPDSVYKAVINEMKSFGVNINRGGYNTSYELSDRIIELREKLSSFFDGYGADNVVFTMNVTVAINMVLQGLLKKGDHVLISALEHNAVYRPIKLLESRGIIEFDIIEADEFGEMDISSLKRLIKPNTRAIVTNFASNICPQVQPIDAIGEIARENGLIYILDAAQGAGSHIISMKESNIDILCFTGHKGLLGPQGTGGFLIRDELVGEVSPVISGGSGSDSLNEFMPEFMPDKFEAGTLNLSGLMGLSAGIDYILDMGIRNISKHESELAKYFIAEVKKLGGYHIYADKYRENMVANVTISARFMDDAILAYILDDEYEIMTRVGMHCTPLAHKTIKSFPKGSVRFSFGLFTTKEEIDYCIKAMHKIQIANSI